MILTKRILVVEDEPTGQLLVRKALASSYQIDMASTIGSAKACLQKHRPDLVLLDFYLPDGDGFDLIQHIKSNPELSDLPIILLTQESAVQVKVRSFSAGVYDFITKPFEAAELMARIQAHLTRSEELQQTNYKPNVVGALQLDSPAKKITLKQGDQTTDLNLSPIEFKILQFLIHNTGKVRTREQLASNVWQRQFFQSRTIDRHISSIRKKLGPCANYLQTVSQGGYRLSVNETEAQ